MSEHPSLILIFTQFIKIKLYVLLSWLPTFDGNVCIFWHSSCLKMDNFTLFSQEGHQGVFQHQWPIPILQALAGETTGQFWCYQPGVSIWSLMGQLVKNLPTTQKTQVRSLEKEMATHSSILTWAIPWTEEPGRLSSTGSQESDMT